MITNKTIDQGQPFDWGKTAPDYAKYRDIYPDLFYQKILNLGLCRRGQNVLDLGTGTGVLPRNLYKHGARFTGVDISEEQIQQARRLSAAAGMDIEYIAASAEEITFPAKSFDVVTASQCFLYFDKAVVLPLIHRILKDDGHFCILYMVWLPEETDIAGHSEDLVLKYNPAWTGGNMDRHTLPQTTHWPEELFELENTETFDMNIPFTRESWHGRMKACRGVGASSLPPETIAAFEADHLQYLNSQPEKFDILHSATIINLRRRDQNP
ncbi:MAG: methyltransferase domain-containing protein [Peptococcaceae bacterium]|nr:methyltransferase domain-containing protein [Peptococcaceae bacterium]